MSEAATATALGRNLRGVVFDLDDTLTAAEFKGEMWARMVEHVRAVLPDADGDELRRRASAARDAHYPALLAGSMDLDVFWRTQLVEAVAGGLSNGHGTSDPNGPSAPPPRVDSRRPEFRPGPARSRS